MLLVTYGTYVDDECFGIQDYDDDTGHDTDDDTDNDTDDDANDDTDDDTDDGGCGTVCVMKIGFGNEEKKLRWGLSTRVLNFVGGTKKSTILVRFVGVVLKKQIQPERSTHSPTEVKETLN